MDMLSKGFKSYEKEKIKNVLHALSLNQSMYEDKKIPLSDLCEMINVKAEFILSPLRYLANNKLVKVTMLKKYVQDLKNYKVEITESGILFKECLEDFMPSHY